MNSEFIKAAKHFGQTSALIDNNFDPEDLPVLRGFVNEMNSNVKRASFKRVLAHSYANLLSSSGFNKSASTIYLNKIANSKEWAPQFDEVINTCISETKNIKRANEMIKTALNPFEAASKFLGSAPNLLWSLPLLLGVSGGAAHWSATRKMDPSPEKKKKPTNKEISDTKQVTNEYDALSARLDRQIHALMRAQNG